MNIHHEIIDIVCQFRDRINELNRDADEKDKTRRWPVFRAPHHGRARASMMRQLIRALGVQYTGRL